MNNPRQTLVRLACLPLAVLSLTALNLPAWGRGLIIKGNEPISVMPDYYPDGTALVINDRHRMYYTEVNGNEHFYFQGETSALNEALRQFAQIDMPRHDIVLLPGPGKAARFDGTHKQCDWMLHVVGGIVKSMTEKEDEAGVWDQYPTLTVYVSGGKVDLAALDIPPRISLLTRDDLKARYLKGIASPSKESRSHASIFLATVDPFGKDSADAIQSLLSEEDSYVRANAAASLARMGKVAQDALPALRKCLNEGGHYTECYQRAIDTITEGPDLANEAKAYEETAKIILVFAQKARAAQKTP